MNQMVYTALLYKVTASIVAVRTTAVRCTATNRPRFPAAHPSRFRVAPPSLPLFPLVWLDTLPGILNSFVIDHYKTNNIISITSPAPSRSGHPRGSSFSAALPAPS